MNKRASHDGLLDDPPERAPRARRQRHGQQHIGCPLPWLRRILPLVNSAEQLAIALWLHRRQAVCRSKTFTVPNQTLIDDLGVSRFTKYRALYHLERARVIAITRDGHHALQVTLLV